MFMFFSVLLALTIYFGTFIQTD
jgi:hypothetical protein